MTVATTELVPCPAESPTAAKRPPSTRCRKHALARLSSNVGADTRAHGYSPRLWPTPYGPHRVAVNFVVGRYYDPQTGQFLSVDAKVQQTEQPYIYVGDDPVQGADPSGMSVNLSGVAAWALTNLHTSGNNGYRDDCTDFVSRALHFGGGDPENEGPFFPFDRSDNHYWYKGGIFGLATYSWAGASELADHLRLNGSRWLVKDGTLPGHSAGQWSEVTPGDVIFVNWHGVSFNGIVHSGIITSIRNGMPYITQHTYDKTYSLAYWINNNDNAHVWIAVPNPG